MYEGYAPHGVAVLGRVRDRQPDPHRGERAQRLQQARRQPRTTGSVAFQFKRMGVFASIRGHRRRLPRALLIDHGLEEFGESTARRGSHSSSRACLFEDFGTLQKALEDRGITPAREQEYICQVPDRAREEQATEVLELIDKLGRTKDVQKVYHTLGVTRRRNPDRFHEPRIARLPRRPLESSSPCRRGAPAMSRSDPLPAAAARASLLSVSRPPARSPRRRLPPPAAARPRFR